MPDSNYLDDLRTAYDADVDRRGAMDLAVWRIEILDAFLDTLNPATAMLELGSGTGQMARHVADRGFDITAVDLSPGNVEATAKRGIGATAADFADMPFDDSAFDAAFALMSLIHVPHDRFGAVFPEIRRVLAPGAHLLMILWGGERHEGSLGREWLDPPRYFSIYPDDVVQALDFPGFEVVDFARRDAPDGGALHVQVLTLRAV